MHITHFLIRLLWARGRDSCVRHAVEVFEGDVEKEVCLVVSKEQIGL